MKRDIKLAGILLLIFAILASCAAASFGQLAIKAPVETLAGDLVVLSVEC